MECANLPPLALPLTADSGNSAVGDAGDVSGGGGVAGEDASKKVRKPYTITKSRESWTEQEHDKFLEALQLFDRDWKKIEAFIGSKTVIQIRSHAQKYFLKVQKNGNCEHVPPPRPKRKAAHPYPQKASKSAPLLSPAAAPFQASSCLLEPGYALQGESSAVLPSCSAGLTVPSWKLGAIQPLVGSSMVEENIGEGAVPASNYCGTSTEGNPTTWQASESNDQINRLPSLPLMPDFAQVYGFLGSVFDPCTSGHLEKLKEMDPIDVETVLLLMKNLSMNLTSSDFEDHRKLLSGYDAGTEELELESSKNSIVTSIPASATFMCV